MSDVFDKVLGKFVDGVIKTVLTPSKPAKRPTRKAAKRPARKALAKHKPAAKPARKAARRKGGAVTCPVCGKSGLRKLANHKPYCPGRG